ncbi:MAG TPA: hypothetical protein VF469_27550, partial [Kofleriaceae bacterium]
MRRTKRCARCAGLVVIGVRCADQLAQALRGALGISGGEPLAERRDKIRERVAARVPAAEQRRVTEFLG